MAIVTWIRSLSTLYSCIEQVNPRIYVPVSYSLTKLHTEIPTALVIRLKKFKFVAQQNRISARGISVVSCV